MKRIRIATLGVALMAVASVAGAQAPQSSDTGKAKAHAEDHRGGHREARGERRGRGPMRGLLRGIELSDAQKTQVRQISEKYRSEFQALRGDRAQGQERQRPDSAKMQQMRSLMDRQQADIRAVLTADQRKTFDQNLAQMKQRMQERQQRRGDRAGSRTS